MEHLFIAFRWHLEGEYRGEHIIDIDIYAKKFIGRIILSTFGHIKKLNI